MNEEAFMSQSMSRRRFIRANVIAGAAVAGGGSVFPHVMEDKTTGQPALLGGEAVRKEPFPSWPVAEELDEQHFLDALRRKEWCRLYGDIASRFEERWAALLGVRRAIGVVNGTNALYGSLYSLDVGPGDEVIVPPYTFVATVNAVVQQFALPVFVDSDLDTFQIDGSKIEAAVNGNTRCIMPVHLGGAAANMDQVLEVAARKKLSVIEDACQAHLAEWRGRKVGSLGDFGCFSFQASKILPCGEGGAAVTNRDDLFDAFHAFQNNGRDRVTGTRHGYLHQGGNLRITEYQAALLIAQLTRFEEQCRRREENADYLTELLEDVPGITPARRYPECTRNTYYIYMFRYDSSGFRDLPKSRFIQAVSREGIPCGSGYRPLNKEPFLEKVLQSRAYRRIYPEERLRRYREEIECPVNERLCREGVFLSQTCLLGSRRDVEDVAAAFLKVRKHAESLRQA
jgi:perosamine synthetase